MRILSRAAAIFNHPTANHITYEITKRDILVLKDAPDWLDKVNLFNWMVSDGTIEVVGRTTTQKEMENDPNVGVHADGKKVEDNTSDIEAMDMIIAGMDVQASESGAEVEAEEVKAPTRRRGRKAVVAE